MAMSMRFFGRRYDNGLPVECDVEHGRIVGIAPLQGAGDTLPWIAPGFVDVQVNGYGGQEFNDFDLDIDAVRRITFSMASHGVTTYCPTATTHSFELLQHVMTTLAAACDEDPEINSRVAGIHLEGPYLSNEDGPRGAHPKEHCRPPNWDEFRLLQDAAKNRIRILTMSPEYDNAPSFIKQVASSGVVVAIGHTAANSAQIQAAVEAGASMSTHLGNGAHGQIRRHPNYIWDQLANDRLDASLIVDGHHLPREVVKSFVRAKTVERCLLVSDITGMAGLPPGRYESPSLASVEVLEDGRLVVAGQRQYLAGAALPITFGIANVMDFADLDLAAAVDLASRRPREVIGLSTEGLEEGAIADLVMFRVEQAETRRIAVTCTIKNGNVVFGDPSV